MSGFNDAPYKRAMQYTAIVLATLAILAVIYRLSEAVLLLILSIIVAAALEDPVEYLERRHIPRGVAILLLYMTVLAGLGFGLYVLARAIGYELAIVTRTFPAHYDQIIAGWQESGSAWLQSLARRLPTMDRAVGTAANGNMAGIGASLLGVTSSILNIAISLIAVLTLSYYWLADHERFERIWLTLLPVRQRAVARRAWHDVERRVGAYVRSEVVQSALLIMILWWIFRLLGVPYPAMYALYAGIAKLVPWIGVPLALLPLSLTLLSSPIWVVVVMAILIILLGLGLERVVEPWLRGDAGAHPILTVLALIIMAKLSGLLGMLIALPLAALFQMVLSELIHLTATASSTETSEEQVQIREIREEIVLLRDDLPPDEQARRKAQGMLARLQLLADQTDDVIRNRNQVRPLDQAPLPKALNEEPLASSY